MSLVRRLRLDARFLIDATRAYAILRKVRPDSEISIADVVEERVAAAPHRIAILFEDEKLTNAELDAGANRVARWASAQGIGRGDVVALYDFADFGALQRYYLSSLDLPVVDWDGSLNVSSGTVCVSDMLPLRGVLGQKENRLFLGTWSFSGTPLVFRDEFMQTAPLFNHYLIGYQHTFGEVVQLPVFQ